MEIVLSLIALQPQSYYITLKPCFITFAWLTELHSSLSDDELLSHGSDMPEWYFNKHVPHLPLPCCFSVHLTHTALSELCLCPRLAPILSQHNYALAAQAGDAHSDLETMGLDEIHSIWFDRDYTFCSVQQYMSNVLGSEPRDFPSFLRDGTRNEY